MFRKITPVTGSMGCGMKQGKLTYVLTNWLAIVIILLEEDNSTRVYYVDEKLE